MIRDLMKVFLPNRLSRKLGLLFLGAVVACGTTSITFTKEKDSSVMQQLQSSWTSAGTQDVQLSLCEDMERSDVWDEPGGCQEAHVVRGLGRAMEHKEKEPSGIGCGGCPFEVLTYVKGTITGGAFLQPAPVTGTIVFGDLYDVEKIYQYPYQLYLDCSGDNPACDSIDGKLFEDGRLELEIIKDINSDKVLIDLYRTGSSECGILE